MKLKRSEKFMSIICGFVLSCYSTIVSSTDLNFIDGETIGYCALDTDRVCNINSDGTVFYGRWVEGPNESNK